MAIQTQVWGILNVTPDSFSDGGQFSDIDEAVSAALEMVRLGACVVDVGGESTRPGALTVARSEEMARTIPVIEELAERGVVVSIDSMHAETARRACEAGATIINDVSGGRHDPDILSVAAEFQTELVLMHWRGPSDIMDSLTSYENVVNDVVNEMQLSVELAIAAGVPSERIILDVGFGFSKDKEQNWKLLRAIDVWNNLGYRTLVGVSRKRFLADCVADSSVATPRDRDTATAALSFYAAQHNVFAVRVHDVPASISAIKTYQKLVG